MVLARSFSADQPSTEKRSRTHPALTIAEFEHGGERRRHRLLGVEAERVEVVGEIVGERRLGVGGLGEPHVVGADEPHGALGALDVAAEPVEVVAGAARQHAGAHAGIGAGRGRQHGDGLDAARADHPDVGGGAAVLHADRARLRRLADAGEAALHHLPAPGRAGEEDPQAHRPRQQAAVDEGRGRREHHRLLADEARAVGVEPGLEAAGGAGAEAAAEDRRVVGLEGQAGRERRADHHPLAVGADVGALGRLAAPPGGDVRQDQRLAEERAGDARHEGEQRAGLEHAGAEGVDEGDGALARGADEAGGAEPRGGVELERVGEGGVEAAPEHGDGAQAGDGADHDPAVLDRQVLAFEQGEAEVAGDVGVLEVGVDERPRGQDGDAGVAVVREALEGLAEAAEEAGEAVDVGLGVEVGVDARGGDAVLQREAGAGGGLGAVAEHPPAAVGAAADLEGDEVQVVAAARAACRPAAAATRGCRRSGSAAGGRRRPGGSGRRGRRPAPRAGRRAARGRGRCGRPRPPRSARARGRAARRARWGRRGCTGGRRRRRRAGTGRRGRNGGGGRRASGGRGARRTAARPGGCGRRGRGARRRPRAAGGSARAGARPGRRPMARGRAPVPTGIPSWGLLRSCS